MVTTRDLPTTSQSGSAYMQTVSDSFKAVSNYSAGNAVNPTGTNAYQFGLDVIDGLDAIPDGMLLTMIIPNTNTASCTFEINGTTTGTKAVVRSNGDSFLGGELQAGTAYTFKFFSGSENHWRLQSQQSTSETQIDTSKTTFPNVLEANRPGSYNFIFPHRAGFRIDVIGGGGAGVQNPTTGVGGGGGGAGGHGVLFGTALSGATISITVGEGGNSSGEGGEASSVSGTDVSVVASGGDGGTGQNGGAGGSASGASISFLGGAGANAAGSTGGGGGGVGVLNNGFSAIDSFGASISNAGTPRVAYLTSSPPPFFLIGAAAASEAGTTSGVFCGGSAFFSADGDGGIGAGGAGGTNNATGGNGGQGLVIISYTTDLDAV